MISRLHQRLGTAGFVLSIIALVAAMSGGAYAALSNADKKLVKKEAKKYSKQFSKQFATPGPAGANGAPGAKGDAGAAGAQGIQGIQGPAGDSVTSTPIASGGVCGSQTGVKYTLKGVSTNICNGQTGFTDTLPSNKTETGIWAGGLNLSGFRIDYIDVSFNIPLASSAYRVNFINNEDEAKGGFDKEAPARTAAEEEAACPGSVTDPKAVAGNLCIYAGTHETEYNKVLSLEINNSGKSKYKSGVILAATLEGEGAATGTYAVTAP